MAIQEAHDDLTWNTSDDYACQSNVDYNYNTYEYNSMIFSDERIHHHETIRSTSMSMCEPWRRRVVVCRRQDIGMMNLILIIN